MLPPYVGRRDWLETRPALYLAARLDALRAWLVRRACEDRQVALLVGTFCVWQLGAALWDLPCTWAWENDGAAPTDFFGGLALNLEPGSGHRYPLFHYLLLAVPCLPVVLIAVATAPQLSFAALRDAILSVPVLTAIAFEIGVGTRFGCIPARHAALLDPIEALRRE